MDAGDANNTFTANCSVRNTAVVLSVYGREAGDTASHAAHTIRVNANNVMNNAQTFFTVGDIVRLGNSSIGYQETQVTAIGATSVSAEYHSGNNTTEWTATCNLTIDDKYRLSTDYGANSSVGDGINSGGLTRFWEGRDLTDVAPGQTDYSNNVANNFVVFNVVEKW